MFRRLFSLVIFTWLLVGCHHHTRETPPPIAQGNERQIAPFTRVYVSGTLNVTLHTGALEPKVALSGDPRDLNYLHWNVKNGILHVTLGKGYPHYGQVSVDISTHYLSTFNFHGVGTVTGVGLQSNLLDVSLANKGKTLLQGQINLRKLDVTGPGFTQISGINSRYLQVKLAGKAHVQLDGVANLASLDINGKGWLSLYWVKSNALKVRAKDHVFFQLAGIADMLDVELWDKARFNGRYLRSTRSFVKTHDTSEADIAVVKRQHTLADDKSNIYFYKLPEMKTDFMACNGAVLDMREWERAFMKEPTRYNL